jgi:hypothetical protein
MDKMTADDWDNLRAFLAEQSKAAREESRAVMLRRAGRAVRIVSTTIGRVEYWKNLGYSFKRSARIVSRAIVSA